MKILILLLIFVLLPQVNSTGAQIKSYKTRTLSKPTHKINVRKTKRFIRTISLGVINGKALNLVKPAYPSAAKAVNAYGRVEVGVLVDESGKVISTHVLNGHLTLQASSLAAALMSTFEPITVNGEPIRVNGVITYNYLPTQWNWLEVGFTLGNGSGYYSISNLKTVFPVGFNDELGFLQQSENDSESWDRIFETMVPMILGKLSSDERSTWLFEAGLTIAQARKDCCRFENQNQRLIRDLNVLLNSSPDGINNEFLKKMRRLAILIRNREIDTYNSADGSLSYKLLDEIEGQFPFVNH